MRAYPNNNNSGNSGNSGNGSSGRTRSSVPSNWMGWKELGKRAYDAGDYEEALNCYKTAIQTEYECPAMDRQVLLSNMVACRLKLASSTSSVAAAAQAAAAVENAQQCIAINPSWSKGHVRLASAYIALGQANTNSSNRSSGTGNNTNGRLYSNDACNALQTALRLDPGNAVARQMLLRELRGRDHSSQAAPSAAAATAPPPPPPQNPNYIPSSSSSPQERGGGGSTNNNNNNSRNTNSPTFMNVDDTVDDDTDLNMSWRQRLQYHQARLVHWYQSQTEIKKSCIKAAVIFLVLYVAFGGRFGLMMESSSSSSSTSSSSSASRSRRQYSYYDEHHHPTTTTDTTATMTRGNYGSGNAYEEYRRRRAQQQGGSQYDEYEYDYYGDMLRQRQRQQQQQQQHYGGSGNSYRSSWSLSSFSIANLFDGSLPSMAILLGIAYICHKYGINPFQVILMLNMIGGGRRHRGGGGMYYGGGGGGFGGGMRYGGGGGGRRRYW